MKYLPKVDKEIANLIQKERKRQEETLMMIPSENIASSAVEEAIGSALSNKYAEGYAHKRYYQGQEIVDQIEDLVTDRAKKLFGVPHVNVQPYSGSPANLAILLALVEPGGTIMGLSLPAGGHLTHGSPSSFSGKLFNAVSYEVTKGGFIDYGAVSQLAKRKKPKLIIAGPTAYARIIDWKKFAQIAASVNAYLLADISHISGLIVGKVYPSPVPYADVIMTTTHKSLRGPRGAMIMVTTKGLKKNPELAKQIDMAVFPGLQGGPHMNTIAGIGVALKEAASSKFKTYATQIVKNAKVLAQELENYDFHLVSGGTDSHLLLIDLKNKNLLGNTAAEALETVGIVLNRNSVPFDTNPPFYPSGIRLGTPGVTSRGMKEKQMKEIATAIHETVNAVSKTKTAQGIKTDQEKKRLVRQELITKTRELKKIASRILDLCKAFPLQKTY